MHPRQPDFAGEEDRLVDQHMSLEPVARQPRGQLTLVIHRMAHVDVRVAPERRMELHLEQTALIHRSNPWTPLVCTEVRCPTSTSCKLPGRSVTRIRPPGKNAMPHGTDNPATTCTTLTSPALVRTATGKSDAMTAPGTAAIARNSGLKETADLDHRGQGHHWIGPRHPGTIKVS